MLRPKRVTVTEVGMRDGFQMESLLLPTETKADIGLALIRAGIRSLEATSFVSPSAVPQLADAASVVSKLKGCGAELSALVPNANGARRAVDAGIDRITGFVSASETHNEKNIRRPISVSLADQKEVGAIARDGAIHFGGAVSTAFGCPFEGDIGEDAVLRVVDGFLVAGADRIALGDTTGMATPPIVEKVCRAVLDRFPHLSIALHFHNTRGLGLVNVVAGLDMGIDRFESSIGGLGGCPFAPNASGNVCTEDLIYMLDELGIETDTDLAALIAVAVRVEKEFGRILPGQVSKAGPRLRGAGS